MPLLNYIWIGSPPDVKSGGVPDHDVMGPKEMSVRCNLHVYFWCLDPYVQHYLKAFEGFNNISVCSVESLIKDSQKIDPSRAQQMSDILNRMLHSSGRGCIKDCVTVKDAFAFFLLAQKGGYVLDTNIVPASKKSVEFKEYDAFFLPKLIADQEIIDEDARLTIDAWMMYSPSNHADRAKLCFDKYVEEWQQTELLFENEGYSTTYAGTCGKNYVTAATLSDSKGRINENNLKYWDSIVQHDNYCVEVPEIGVMKYYYNTHLHNQSEYGTQIFYDILYGTPDKVRKLLEAGHPHNIRFSNRAIHDTPLHCAVSSRRLEMVDILLKAGADLDAVAIYRARGKGLIVTPLELAEYLGDLDCVRLISSYRNERDKMKTILFDPLTLLQNSSCFWKDSLVSEERKKVEKFVLHVPNNGF